MSTPDTPPTAKEIAKVKRLVKRAKKLLADLDQARYLMSFITGGGQPRAILHPEKMDLENDGNCCSKPGVYDLGNTGVGDMLAL